MWARRFFPSLALLLVLIVAYPSLAQPLDCRDLVPEPGPLGYAARFGSERCEGLFRPRVSGSGRLELVSLTLGRIAYTRQTEFLNVSRRGPSASGGQTLRLNATALSLGVYYRMAAMLDTQPFRLPLAPVIRPARLDPGDLGMLAWREIAGGQRTYIPVLVRPDATAVEAEDRVRVILRPENGDVRDLRWRLIPGGATEPVPGATGIVTSGRSLPLEFPWASGMEEATLVIAFRSTNGTDRVLRIPMAAR